MAPVTGGQLAWSRIRRRCRKPGELHADRWQIVRTRKLNGMVADPVLPALSERHLAALEQAKLVLERVTETQVRLRDTRMLVEQGRGRREILHDSAYARLAARLESLPVVEQAKGILMAQTGCTADEAFDMLRTASQRSNVKLRDVALKITQGAVRNGRRRP